VVGAESSGTTTLARALAEHYECEWVAEYGREYSARTFDGPQGKRWETAEFIHIAMEQARREEEAAAASSGLVICDTNAFATGIWHERYLGTPSAEVDSIGRRSHADLYLLTDVDIPFVQDGLRDGEHVRAWMHSRFLQALPKTWSPFAVIRGSTEDRLRSAVALVDHLLERDR
jgi:NadR type nicotinamide-nucleotide adenylyltransferase